MEDDRQTKTNSTRIALWLVVLVIGIVGVLAVNRQNETNKVKIGAAFALSGDAAPWGEVSKKTVMMAVDTVNKAGGIHGKPLEVIFEDTKSSSKDSVTAVSKLVNIDKVNAVMITWLDSYPGAESVVPSTIPLISQDAAIESVNVPVNHPNVFSLWYRTASKAKVTIEAMAQSGVKRLYMVTLNDPYYATLRTFLKDEAKKQGVLIVGDEALTSNDDARTTLAKIHTEKPDAVFFGSYDDKLSISFVKRYRELVERSVPLWGDEFIEQDLANKNFTPSWLEGVTYYVPADMDPEFISAYRSRFGEAPKFSAGTTYDTVMILAEYLKASPQDVNQYLRSQKFSTITYGEITFDAIGGVASPNEAIRLKKVSQGVGVPLR